MDTIDTEIYFDVTLSQDERNAIQRIVGDQGEVSKKAKLWVVVQTKVQKEIEEGKCQRKSA